MGYSKKNVNSVYEDFERIRDENKAQAESRLFEVYAKCPEIKAIDKELSRVGLDIFGATMMGKEGLEKRLNELQEKNELLQQRRIELLRDMGYDADYTDIKYNCPLCMDTGYQGAKMCQCLKTALTLKGYESSGILNLLKSQSFESFSIDVYPQECQSIMQKNYKKLHKFAENFETNKEFFLLAGGTGLGKTHLSTSVAKVLIEKGYDVVYEIAQNIFSDFDTDRFRDRYSDSELLSEKYLDCDLLIIDDLGTEIVTNYTVSYLYNIINTRINKKLPIIISTNLSAKEIKAMYHERITSRLFGEFTVIKFEGCDIRKKKISG
ncbi:MAG: ATP-binding protein [Clostridia bacterium]|nr:ATP-binding protein [Clostridia bacterium]